MSLPQEKVFISEAEYLEMERKSLKKHEYYKGECFAMAGSSRRHNTLSLNIASLFVNFFRKKHCQPYIADMRLQIDTHGHYVYPDVMLVCNEAAYVTEDMVNDATVIIEVLSKSTEQYDRGMKFLHYQSLPSLKAYILVSQESIQVEVYLHQDKDQWTYELLKQPDDHLHLDCVNFSCSLAEFYASVNV
ncbi:MAG: Uma2 family endonuclease [Candidatus Magnetomorum sp.]|nr:Uma2 family endonuclease [Candidatus Magnetomorum sp.]